MSFSLYLMRHGIAEDFDPARMRSDADRRLTAEGRDRLHKQAKVLASLDLGIERLFSSPYHRAKETAQIVASELGKKLSLEITDALVPHASVDALLEELRAMNVGVPTLVFGHEPLLSSIIAYVLGDKNAAVEMKKGALAGLDIARLTPPFRGHLVCLVPPRMLRSLA